MTAPPTAARSTRRRSRLPRASVGALLILAGWLLAAQPLSAQSEPGDGYVADVADLPLMEGLSEVADAGMAFDKPSGRIVEAYAHGAVTTARVRRFYRETLPQLGWERLARDLYAREGERLEIDYLGSDGDLTVRYTLQPR